MASATVIAKRLEPRLVRGPTVIHVHNGGVTDKLNPSRVWREEKVHTLATVWVHPDTPDIGEELPPTGRKRKLTKQMKALRELGVSSRSEIRAGNLELARDIAREQGAMERELRAMGYTWRQVEKMCGGRFPSTVAEFMTRYVNKPGDSVPIVPVYDEGYAKTFRGTPPAIREAARQAVAAA